jgi:hypothetical protein
VHTRTESLAAFTRDFRLRVTTDPQFREEVQALRGKRLGCYCTGPCHGEVIVAWLEEGRANTAGVPVRE